MTLETGEVFSPLHHAADRWEVVIPCHYSAIGSQHELLYQTADDQFVRILALIGPRNWYSEDVEEAGLVNHDDARYWLQQANFMLPDCLMKGLKTFPAVPKKQPKAAEPASNPRTPTRPASVHIGNWDEGGKAFAEAFKTANGGGNPEANASPPGPPAAADEGEDEQQVPALTKAERATLLALATFDASRLASALEVSEAMPGVSYSERSAREAIKKLVALNLAERPEGEKQGARLTIKGRRLASRLDD